MHCIKFLHRWKRKVNPWNFGLFCLVVTFVAIANFSTMNSSEIFGEIFGQIPYPSALPQSRTYSVTVNNQPVSVQKYNEISYVQFPLVEQANIEITADEPASQYTLSPKSYNIPSNRDGNKISFSLNAPRKLILHQVNSADEKLFIFAEPPEEKPPQLRDPNVTNIIDYGVDNTGQNEATPLIQTAIDEVSAKQGILYFPPGVYKTRELYLKSNMTLYLAPGSVLEATKEIEPSYGQGLINIENASNVKLIGRGTINGNGTYWRPRGGWYSLILMKNANNITLEDILIQDPAVANVWMSYSENVKVYNVKILADPQPEFLNTDGFNFWSSRNITIDNVLYKGTDDATSIGGDKNGRIQNSENINIRNSVFYGGNGFKIGATAKQDVIRNITYENIDVVFANEVSGFWPVTGANFENIYFKNIRVEDILDSPQEDKAALVWNWNIRPVSWQKDSSPNKFGYIRNVYVSNLQVDDRGGANSVFHGYDNQRNISVNFDNLSVYGKPVLNPDDAYFDVQNQFVDLKFTNSNPAIVNINVPDPDASESGDAGQFLVTRTGDTSQALMVNYIIRGTAENGIDYQTITNSVTIPAGASSASIGILPKSDSINERTETVFLGLENMPNSTNYLLGPNFHAVVNIRD
ncbi:Na-Ca exchanger/integrin-beta4 like protein [Microseira wollei NIES-4236]|uniref:Na-Ca exchanger/integrin-beta4 like protein n=2 Tax=Microseira wollei TaxID=467598 RepID=A0AAV3XJJ4_9CYAN|nr:Na-Ca exchanger/integrin-beta4 like protein [Microseira wollei NIES-4236]